MLRKFNVVVMLQLAKAFDSTDTQGVPNGSILS